MADVRLGPKVYENPVVFIIIASASLMIRLKCGGIVGRWNLDRDSLCASIDTQPYHDIAQ